jgi:hypothetical protein
MLPLGYLTDLSNGNPAENINYNKMWAVIEINIP